MANCKQCGAYIPIGETACPACGYDPEAEARRAKEEKERAEAEARKAKEEAEAAERRKQQEEERRKAQQESWAEQQRRREEQQKQYASYGSATQGQYASQSSARPTWAPPWQETQNHGNSSGTTYTSGSYSSGASYTSGTYNTGTYERNRAQAASSVAHQRLSVLSYFGPLFFIPLTLRGNDDFTRYHANQGLILFLAGLVCNAVGASTGGVLNLLWGCFSIYCTVKGISNVIKGKKEPLPLIGKLRLIK